MARIVSEGVSVKLNGEENVVLVFEDADADDGGKYLWGFPSRVEFGAFVAALQGFYVEVTRP